MTCLNSIFKNQITKSIKSGNTKDVILPSGHQYTNENYRMFLVYGIYRNIIQSFVCHKKYSKLSNSTIVCPGEQLKQFGVLFCNADILRSYYMRCGFMFYPYYEYGMVKKTDFWILHVDCWILVFQCVVFDIVLI